MYRVTKTLEVSGAHYLNLPYESKCKNLHGHNWIIDVTCECNDDALNESGMVVDFTVIKQKVSDLFDHKFINEIPPFHKINPTAENIAKFICDSIPHCVSVRVQESSGNVAEYVKGE